MSEADVHQKLNGANEITLSVKGRTLGRDIPTPVWFTHEDNTVYLLPVQGSDTNWYKNLLSDQTLKISANGFEIDSRGKPIMDHNGVGDVVRRFRSKYGEGDIKRYYTNFDAAVEVSL